MSEERWAPVLGHEGTYEVSDLGRVRSVDRDKLCADGQWRHWRGRELRLARNEEGRAFVTVSTTRLVSHLVLESFVGPRPLGLHACHNDGDPTNDTLTNLRWDTPSGNMQDKVRHGNHHSSKKTHCPRGHVLSDPNLAHVPEGHRQYRICLACRRARGTRGNARVAGRELGMDIDALADQHYARIMAEQEQVSA